jgi:thiol-disulfide isomerase/thioredoxin
MSSKPSKKSKDISAPAEPESKGLTQKQKNYIYTGVFLTIILFLFIVNNYNGEPEEGPYPPYYLESLQNNLRLSDYQGKVVLLEFWATWNDNSRKITPDLVELKNFFDKNEFEIIGVSVDDTRGESSPKEDVAAFIKEFSINYPVVHAKAKTISDYGGIPTLPVLFVIDKDGNIVAHHQGLVDKLTLINEIKVAIDGNNEEGSLVAPDFNLPRENKDTLSSG